MASPQMTSHAYSSVADAESSTGFSLGTSGVRTPEGSTPYNAPHHVKRKRNKKPRTAFFGLGGGWAGRLTGAALLALIMASIGIPALVVKQQYEDGKLRFPLDTPQLGTPQVVQVSAGPVLEPKDGTVPVTADLYPSFQALRSTTDHGILLLTAEEDWSQVRENFLAAVDNPNLFGSRGETPAEKQAALRANMAMDLACLENAVVEAQTAIDSTPRAEIPLLTERYQKKIDARRRQAEAAALWEVAVKQNLLGCDAALKNAMLRLLAVVRSRAAASEYFTLCLMHQQHDEEEDTLRRGYGEANSAYEAVASLTVAGQIVATNPVLAMDVANWLAILFISV